MVHPWQDMEMATIARTSLSNRPVSLLRNWLPLALLPTATWISGAEFRWPDWITMWLLAFSLYAGIKWLTFAEYVRFQAVPLPWALSYLLLWPGMNAEAFFASPQPRSVSPGQFLHVGMKIVLGSLLLGIVAPRLLPGEPLLASWTMLAGLYFLLHSGLMHGLALLWQAAGFRTEPLMHWPIVARSVADFWGRRWNTAFRDFAQRFIFRPLVRQRGAALATLIVFLVSGIIHDLAISLPSRGGYGLPTLYFLIQGAMLLLERSQWGKAIRLGAGGRGRVFAVLVVLLPAPLLFHEPFMRRVVQPMIHAVQATF